MAGKRSVTFVNSFQNLSFRNQYVFPWGDFRHPVFNMARIVMILDLLKACQPQFAFRALKLIQSPAVDVALSKYDVEAVGRNGDATQAELAGLVKEVADLGQVFPNKAAVDLSEGVAVGGFFRVFDEVIFRLGVIVKYFST